MKLRKVNIFFCNFLKHYHRDNGRFKFKTIKLSYEKHIVRGLSFGIFDGANWHGS